MTPDRYVPGNAVRDTSFPATPPTPRPVSGPGEGWLIFRDLGGGGGGVYSGSPPGPPPSAGGLLQASCRTPTFWDRHHSCEVLWPALGLQKRKLSSTFPLTDFPSRPQFTGEAASGPSPERDRWDRVEKSHLRVISCGSVMNGKNACECGVAAASHTVWCSSSSPPCRTASRWSSQEHLREKPFWRKRQTTHSVRQ